MLAATPVTSAAMLRSRSLSTMEEKQIFTQLTPIAAVSSASGLIDLFGVATDGQVYRAWWHGSGWHGWSPVQSAFFAQATPIAAVSSASGLIDLYGVGEDGRVWTAWWRGGPTWGGWRRIETPVQLAFAQTTPITAVSSASGLIDLLAVASDQRVYHAWWRGSAWGGWKLVAPASFLQRTPVSAVSSASGLIDIFAVPNDGAVWTASWRGSAWSGWSHVQSPTQSVDFAQGTPITAISSASGLIDLFGVATDNQVHHAWWRGSNWDGWVNVQSEAFAQLTPIGGVSSDSGFIDLFGVRREDDRVYTASWRGNGWQGWSPVQSGVFASDAPITAVSCAPGLIDLFGVGKDGRVWSAWWRGSQWEGWRPII
jgi:hypothetical protein